MSRPLEQLAWPSHQLGAGLRALARASGLADGVSKSETESPSPEGFSWWMETLAARLGLEAQPIEFSVAELEAELPIAGPAVLRLPEQNRFLLLTSKGRILSPDLKTHRVPITALRQCICADLETPHRARFNRLMEEAGVPRHKRPDLGESMIRQRIRDASIGGCWMLRASPGSGFWRQFRLVRGPQRLAALATVHATQHLFWLLAWWMAGKGALEGRLDQGWLLCWVLVVMTIIPMRLAETWLQGRLAVDGGGLLKQRLLFGALCMDPDAVRRQGAGQLLGRVIEADALESLALNGGFVALTATIELVISAGVLAVGTGGASHVLLLASWVGLTALSGWRYLRRRERWTEARLAMTSDLVESLIGRRTRLAQETRGQWHDREDQALEQYAFLSKQMDAAATLFALAPRGWLLAAFGILASAFASGGATPAALAAAIGGILLAWRALKQISDSIGQLAGAWIAWQRVAPLYDAARESRAPACALPPTGQTVLETRSLVFRHRIMGAPTLNKCSLHIHARDRLLIEGPSGGGKSSLASVLGGLRTTESGLLLSGGLDLETLGLEAWRRRVALAPQFHENHVLTGTLAFNVLLGAQNYDVQAAEEICMELGLGNLLSRMPAGMLQNVGESGWQLSHGERSRLYIARVLLQGADLLILDESFASLDPETLRLCLECVLRRAHAVLVVAHP